MYPELSLLPGEGGRDGDYPKHHHKKVTGKQSGGSQNKYFQQSEFFTPSSFSDALMRSFFSVKVLLPLSALGFGVNRLHIIHCLQILQHCKEAWKLISVGYKIPFMFIPHKSTHNQPTPKQLDLHMTYLLKMA